MMSEQTQQKIRLAERAVSVQTLTLRQQEDIQAALTILLGSETEYHTRVRATRRLARQGADILPLVLTTLSTYPEITAPTWPWWPLQYEQCSHLLIYLGQKAHMQLV